MLDIKRIINNKEEVVSGLSKRGLSINFDGFIDLYNKRKEILIEVENLKKDKNILAKKVGELKRNNQDVFSFLTKMSTMKEKIDSLDNEVSEYEVKINNFLLSLPNIPDDDVLAGDKENNQVINIFKDKPSFDFEIKDHIIMAKELNIIDYQRGAKLSGHGYWIYKDIGARLEWALINYFIDFHLKNGYEFLLPPHILNDECGYTAGQFPKFKDDVFQIKCGGFLLPTAETAIINYHRNEILDYKILPKKYFSYTPCYRREAGSHRKNERGMIRGHQFNKVEMFCFTKIQDSPNMLDELVANAEKLVQGLGLHYRVTKLAAKDISASMAKTYDIEVWIPSMNEYKEVSSVSNARDYQSRRGMIRYKDKDGKIKYIHALNGSGLATPRIIPAILEQFQNKDGSVSIPKVLQPYMHELKKLNKI